MNEGAVSAVQRTGAEYGHFSRSEMDSAMDFGHAWVAEVVMPRSSTLLRIQPDIIVNMQNIAYIELTGKGGADIHFAGRIKPLHLTPTEAESLRDYISGEDVTDLGKAA